MNPSIAAVNRNQFRVVMFKPSEVDAIPRGDQRSLARLRRIDADAGCNSHSFLAEFEM